MKMQRNNAKSMEVKKQKKLYEAYKETSTRQDTGQYKTAHDIDQVTRQDNTVTQETEREREREKEKEDNTIMNRRSIVSRLFIFKASLVYTMAILVYLFTNRDWIPLHVVVYSTVWYLGDCSR